MSVRLVAFDLDGTLLRGETCVQAIARAIGRLDECAAFERLSMRDLEGVTAAREAMRQWYAAHSTAELMESLDRLEVAPGCAQAFDLLRRHGLQTAIVSLTWSVAVEHFAARFGADYFHGTQLLEQGIEHVWPEDKGAWLRALRCELGLEEREVAAVGDSEGDRELLEAATVRFFVGQQPLDGLPGVVHLPGADIFSIAQRLVADN